MRKKEVERGVERERVQNEEERGREKGRESEG